MSLPAVTAPRALYLLLLWAAASALAVVFALSWLPAVFDGQHYYPLGPDSFYHARRMLDTLAHVPFYEFDSAIHAPAGSLLTWPWAYDRLVAGVAGLLLRLAPARDPMQLLVYAPVAIVPVNVALVIGVGLLARLPWWALVLFTLAYASSPLTRELHAVGMLDHHYVEHLFFLAVLFSGMAWLRAPSRWRAIACGCVLGAAPAFHNGLFVLQVFLVGAVMLLWLRRLLILAGSEGAFAAALLLTTLAALLPSEAFQRFEWKFYYLGWFHLVAAVATAGTVVWLARCAPDRRQLALLAAAVAVGAALAWNQIGHGGRFVMAELPTLRDVTEARSVVEALQHGQWFDLLQRYGGLLYLLPLSLAGLAVSAVRSRTPAQVLLAVTLLAGGALLLQQLRLHYFGSLAVLLAPLQWAALHATSRAHMLLAGVLYAALQAPAAATFGSFPDFAGDRNYAINRRLLQALGDQCRQRPGVVLAHFGDGHYLRYHTACAVIANNFIMTPRHMERIALTETLFTLPAADLRERYPWIDYVYLWRLDNPLAGRSEATVRRANPRLHRELLLGGDVPPGYRLLGEIAFDIPGRGQVVFARAYQIVH